MTQRSAGVAREPGAGEARRPVDAFWDRFRTWDWSRMRRGGRQIASCELGLVGAGPSGAFLAGRGRYELARRDSEAWG